MRRRASRRSATTASPALPARRAAARAGAARRGVRRAGRLVRRGARAAPGAEHHRAPADRLRRARMPAPSSSRATSRPSWTRCARATSSSRRSRTSCGRRSPRSSATSTSRSRTPTSPITSASNLDIAERNAERLLRHRRRHPRGLELVVVVGRGIASRRRTSTRATSSARRPRRCAPRAAARAITIDTDRARGGAGVGRSAAAAAGRRQPALERDHVQPRRRHGVPRHDERRHVELDPGARHRGRHQRGRPVAAVPALLQGRRRRAAPAPDSASRSARDIVRAHGGELGLHSSPGVGSTFIVKLPRRPRHPDGPRRRDPP